MVKNTDLWKVMSTAAPVFKPSAAFWVLIPAIISVKLLILVWQERCGGKNFLLDLRGPLWSEVKQNLRSSVAFHCSELMLVLL